MSDLYLTRIYVNDSRNVENLDIPLSKTEKKHLILTGKNGSGKTSLLREIHTFLRQLENNSYNLYDQNVENLKRIEKRLEVEELQKEQKFNLVKQIRKSRNWLRSFGGTYLEFSELKNEILEKYNNGEFIIAFFDSKRHTNLTVPQGINKIQLKKKYGSNERPGQHLIQYIVNLKADRSFARDDGEMEVVKEIDDWFERFENRLKELFQEPYLKLEFDRANYNFNIRLENREPFSFNQLADGYSAIINIISELLLRMEHQNSSAYDIEGIVLIDEIETHLHVDLQKNILPFLCDFFPKIQFIITTHSPFVLNSISNTVICDLEHKIVTSDLSGYSYDAIIESYFFSDKYSNEIKKKVELFEKLIDAKDRSKEEDQELKNLRNYFAHTPKYLSKELMVKLQEIALRELNK